MIGLIFDCVELAVMCIPFVLLFIVGAIFWDIVIRIVLWIIGWLF